MHDGETADEEFLVGALALPAEDGEDPDVYEVIFVCCLDDRSLVALPQPAWNRRAANRRFPRGSLVRATAVEVAAAPRGSRAQRADGVRIKIWLGFLEESLVDATVFDGSVEPNVLFLAPGGGDGYLPLGDALVEVAKDKFQFHTVTCSRQSWRRPASSTGGSDACDDRNGEGDERFCASAEVECLHWSGSRLGSRSFKRRAGGRDWLAVPVREPCMTNGKSSKAREGVGSGRLKVPGANAPPIKVAGLSNSLPRLLLAVRCSFSAFRGHGPPAPTSIRAPPGIGAGTPLSRKQWQMVELLAELVGDGFESVAFGPAELGRTASKLEDQDAILGALRRTLLESERDLPRYIVPHGAPAGRSTGRDAGTGSDGLQGQNLSRSKPFGWIAGKLPRKNPIAACL